MAKTKRNKLAVWTASVCAFGMVMGLVACAPQATTDDKTDQKADENKTVQVETPEADKFGVVVAESWKDAYPDQYASYLENESNSPDSGKFLEKVRDAEAWSQPGGYDRRSKNISLLE